MELLEAIDSRSSAKRLAEPGPARSDIERILCSGARAPDHGQLAPWRFVVLQGTARERLGAAMAESFRAKHPAATAEQLQAESAKSKRAPAIVVVASRATKGHKVPEVEQFAATAACVQNMLLTAHALGYGAMWKTGGPAYDARVREEIGLTADDCIVAFVYLGTALTRAPVREPALQDRVVWLQA